MLWQLGRWTGGSCRGLEQASNFTPALAAAAMPGPPPCRRRCAQRQSVRCSDGHGGRRAAKIWSYSGSALSSQREEPRFCSCYEWQVRHEFVVLNKLCLSSIILGAKQQASRTNWKSEISRLRYIPYIHWVYTAFESG